MADNVVEIVVQLRDASSAELKNLERNLRAALDTQSQAFVSQRTGKQTTDALSDSVDKLSLALAKKNATLKTANATLQQQQVIISALTAGYNQAATSVAAASAAHSSGSRNILQYAAGYVTGRLAIDAFNASIRLIPGLIKDGLGTIDKLRMSAASMAGAMLTTNPSMGFEEGLGRANAIMMKTFELSGKFVGNARELQVFAEAMTTFGMKMDLVTKKGQDQFVTFANILKLVTQGQNFEIQAFQELRALMMGQNFQGAMLARRLEAMGVNVKAMIPLWVEQGTLVENVVRILGGYEKASTAIFMTLEAQKRTLESMIQKTLAIGLKEVYEDFTKLLLEINKQLIGDDSRKGLALKFGNDIAEAYKQVKQDSQDIRMIWGDIITAIAWISGAGKNKQGEGKPGREWYDPYIPANEQAQSSPILAAYKWARERVTGSMSGTGPGRYFMDQNKIKYESEQKDMALQDYYGYGPGMSGYPAATIAGPGKPPSEEELKKYIRTLREIEDFEMESIIRRTKNWDTWEGKKTEASWKNYKEYLKIQDWLKAALEDKTLIPYKDLQAMKPEDRQDALKARYAQLEANASKIMMEKNREDSFNIDNEKFEHMAKINKKIREMEEKEAGKSVKIWDAMEEEKRKLTEKYAPDKEGVSPWLESETRSIDTWVVRMTKAADDAFGGWTDQAVEAGVAIRKLGADMKGLAYEKGTERSRIAIDALRETVREWKMEAETPVRWPWNEHEIAVIEGTTHALEDYTRKLAALRKTNEREGITGEEAINSEDVLYRRYIAATERVKKANDEVARVTSEVWRGWYRSMGDTLTTFFDETMQGHMQTSINYWKMFCNSMRQVFARAISDMIMESMRLKMGSGLGEWFGLATKGLGSILGVGGSSITQAEFEASGFAKGGVVHSPTLFKFAQGIGVMGEAGSEGILPLKRTRSGDLGVQSEGGGGSRNVKVEIINPQGMPMKATDTKVRFNGQEMVVSVWLDAFNRNAFGLRSALGA